MGHMMPEPQSQRCSKAQASSICVLLAAKATQHGGPSFKTYKMYCTPSRPGHRTDQQGLLLVGVGLLVTSPHNITCIAATHDHMHDDKAHQLMPRVYSLRRLQPAIIKSPPAGLATIPTSWCSNPEPDQTCHQHPPATPSHTCTPWLLQHMLQARTARAVRMHAVGKIGLEHPSQTPQ